METGECIERAIKRQKLTKASVADQIGISRQQLNDIVHQRRPLPIKLVRPLCKALHCDPNCIFDWEAGNSGE